MNSRLRRLEFEANIQAQALSKALEGAMGALLAGGASRPVRGAGRHRRVSADAFMAEAGMTL